MLSFHLFLATNFSFFLCIYTVIKAPLFVSTLSPHFSHSSLSPSFYYLKSHLCFSLSLFFSYASSFLPLSSAAPSFPPCPTLSPFILASFLSVYLYFLFLCFFPLKCTLLQRLTWKYYKYNLCSFSEIVRTQEKYKETIHENNLSDTSISCNIRTYLRIGLIRPFYKCLDTGS